MPDPLRGPRAAAVAAFAVLLALAALVRPAAAQPPPTPAGAPVEAEPEGFHNLQVLPQDITRPELIATMRGFTRALGVRCQHCHVGEEGMPLTEFDFMSDEKPSKAKARVMLEMVRKINSDFMPRVEADSRVSCVTCHHGSPHPETLAEALARVYEQGGAEAAAGRYRQLREQYYGGWTYDFGERALLGFADDLAEDGDAAGAMAMVELNLEHYPDSAISWFSLGELRHEGGDAAGAAAAYRRTLELDPRFVPAQRRLDEMEPPAAAPETEAPEAEATAPPPGAPR